jgi:hypothetical protein
VVGKPEGRRPLGRPRRRWVDNTFCFATIDKVLFTVNITRNRMQNPIIKDNIKMDLGEVGWRDVDWISLAQDRNRSPRANYTDRATAPCRRS